MFWLAKQIFSPLSYLRIKQGNGLFTSKKTIDWVVPITMSILTVIVLQMLPMSMSLLGPGGLIIQFLGLLEMMAAFFIAALAAVATFDRKGLDDRMRGEPATLMRYRKSAKGYVEHILSWREFICFLFGYLSFSSLSFFIVINFARFVVPAVSDLVIASYPFAICITALLVKFLFFLFFWQLILTMFLGIYFLCDRLQVMDDPDV